MRVQHPLGEHLATCSGPEDCAEYAAVLSMTPAQHANYVNESTARFAQKRTARQFRVSQQEDFSPPDAYAPAIAMRRQTEAAPASRFADRYAAERLAAFVEEQAAALPPLRVLSAADLAEYAPPDPWAAGIKALQAKETK